MIECEDQQTGSLPLTLILPVRRADDFKCTLDTGGKEATMVEVMASSCRAHKGQAKMDEERMLKVPSSKHATWPASEEKPN